MFQTGLRAAAQRVPFLPMRAGLGSAVLENDPTLRTVTQSVRRRRGAGRRTRARARRRAGAHEPRRPVRQRAVPRARPLLRRPVLHGREGGLRVDRADHRHRRHDRRRRDPDDAAQPHHGRRRRGDAQRRALHHVHADLRARREVPEGLRHRGEDPGGLGGVRGAVPVRERAGLPGRRRSRSSEQPRRSRHERRDPRRVLRRSPSPTASPTTARSWAARWACSPASARGWPS